MTKEINAKSTKEQILAAYHEALEQANKKSITPVEEKVLSTKASKVNEVKEYGYERLNEDLSQLGIGIIKSIDIFRKNIDAEYNNFCKLEEAIKLEKEHLEDLYGIKENAHTLSSIIIANSQQKSKFNADMEADETCWKVKLNDLELEYKSKKLDLEKQRKREEEEYNYNLNQQRRLDTDKYEQAREIRLKELNLREKYIEEREQIVSDQESKFIELENKLISSESGTLARIEVAKSDTIKLLEQEFKFNQAIKEEQYKSSVDLLNQKVESGLQKIQEQEVIIENINKQLQQAQEQSQQIAHKALETSIQRNLIINPNDSQSK